MILIACPTCDRQYDVSHVPTGERVRCLCDEVITVGTQKSMQVRAMHCSHCSGAVAAEEANCRWCGAKLTAKDRLRSTLCPKCFTRIEDDARHCKSCGVAITPQALTPLPEDKACPRCRAGLLIRALGVADVVECGGCGGMWLNAHVFDAVCRDAERRLQTFHPAPIATEPPQQQREPLGRTYIPCLACRQLMLRRNFRYGARPSGVILDYCRGHGVWLDKDELERVVHHVAHHGGAERAGQDLAPYLEPRLDVARSRAAGASRSSSPSSTPVGGGILEGLSELILALGSSLFD